MGILMSPVAFFAASVPIAFYSVGLAVAVWFLFVPLQLVATQTAGHRRVPELITPTVLTGSSLFCSRFVGVGL